MSAGLTRTVASLLVPVDAGLLVLPTAMVSEVRTAIGIRPVPGTRPWMLGYVIWRGVPVSVVSFDRLFGGHHRGDDIRNLVVLYPLPGRQSYDYIAIATHAEPHTTFIDSAVQPGSVPADLPLKYVAGLLTLPQGLGIIPDFHALTSAFYGSPSLKR